MDKFHDTAHLMGFLAWSLSPGLVMTHWLLSNSENDPWLVLLPSLGKLHDTTHLLGLHVFRTASRFSYDTLRCLKLWIWCLMARLLPCFCQAPWYCSFPGLAGLLTVSWFSCNTLAWLKLLKFWIWSWLLVLVPCLGQAPWYSPFSCPGQTKTLIHLALTALFLVKVMRVQKQSGTQIHQNPNASKKGSLYRQTFAIVIIVC